MNAFSSWLTVDLRRRRIEFPGFRPESLEENPNNPVNPVKRYFIKIESIPLKEQMNINFLLASP